MGSFLSKPRPAEPLQNLHAEQDQRGVKREREEDGNELSDEAEKERIEEENLLMPKRKKLKSTSQFIYNALFVDGQDSDLTIKALGRDWKVHKLYISQSTYFSGMFSGAWKESGQNVIEMDIPDENIDEDAFEIALGSMYTDDIEIQPVKVIAVLAAACLLGLDALELQCGNIMIESICTTTVCAYYQASQIYCQSEITQACFNWLMKNVMNCTSNQLLREISVPLMASLVNSPELFVMQVEMDVYSLLKKWMYIQIEPNFTGTYKQLGHVGDTHWKRKVQVDRVSFLQTQQGEKYIPAFRELRMQHIINDFASAKILEDDGIIPVTWILPMYRQQWFHMIKVEQGQDKGPDNISLEMFNKWALRCGRVLHVDGEYCWRWTGYNYSLDILVSFSRRLLVFKRNSHSQPSPGGVSLHPNRNFYYRMTVASLDNMGHVRYQNTTGLSKLGLSKDEDVVVMSIDHKVELFPLHISCQFLVFTPRPEFANLPHCHLMIAGDAVVSDGGASNRQSRVEQRSAATAEGISSSSFPSTSRSESSQAVNRPTHPPVGQEVALTLPTQAPPGPELAPSIPTHSPSGSELARSTGTSAQPTAQPESSPPPTPSTPRSEFVSPTGAAESSARRDATMSPDCVVSPSDNASSSVGNTQPVSSDVPCSSVPVGPAQAAGLGRRHNESPTAGLSRQVVHPQSPPLPGHVSPDSARGTLRGNAMHGRPVISRGVNVLEPSCRAYEDPGHAGLHNGPLDPRVRRSENQGLQHPGLVEPDAEADPPPQQQQLMDLQPLARPAPPNNVRMRLMRLNHLNRLVPNQVIHINDYRHDDLRLLVYSRHQNVPHNPPPPPPPAVGHFPRADQPMRASLPPHIHQMEVVHFDPGNPNLNIPFVAALENQDIVEEEPGGDNEL